MATRTVLLATAILLAFPGLAQQPEAPPTPLPRAPIIVPAPLALVRHVKLDLRFDLEQRHASGTATLDLVWRGDPDTLRLDAAALDIHSVHTADGRTLAYRYDGSAANGALRIALPAGYASGDPLTLVIAYRTTHLNESDPNNLGGSNGKGLRFFGPTTTEPRKRKQVWSMAELGSNRYWFPGCDRLGVHHTTELLATVDADLEALSNGELIATTPNKDGTHTFHWRDDRPHANHQVVLAIGQWTDVPQRWNNVALHNHSYPDEVEATAASVVRLPDMMGFFSAYTGVPYPAESYHQVFVQDLPWGMYGRGTSVQTENMVDDFGTHADFFYLWDGLQAEALAHQWYGSAITSGDLSTLWMDRGLTRFLAERYHEARNGRDEYLLWVHQFDLNTYLNDWNNGLRHPIVMDYADSVELATDNYTYVRAALVLQLLRETIGDTAFEAGLRNYTQRYLHHPAHPDAFMQAMEKASGQALGVFFDQWLYALGHPLFEVSTRYDSEAGQLRLSLTQTQDPDTADRSRLSPYFGGRMRIAIDDSIHQVVLQPTRINLLSLPAAQPPKLVNVDVGHTWIAEYHFEKTAAELLHQFQHDRDVLGRREAMQRLSAIATDSTTSDALRDSIREAFHRVIEDRSTYWRVRYGALLALRGLIVPPFDAATITVLNGTIEHERSWDRAAAIGTLGLSDDPDLAPLYIRYLTDSSDRVVNAAAIALGRSKSPLAYDALVKLKDKPSWKDQSLISALNGLKELGDPRGADLAMEALRDDPPGARWTLATPVWDYRLAAANTLVALGRQRDASPIVLRRYKAALRENDVNDIFSNILLMVTLGDERTRALFPDLRARYSGDANALNAVDAYEAQLDQMLGK